VVVAKDLNVLTAMSKLRQGSYFAYPKENLVLYIKLPLKVERTLNNEKEQIYGRQ
jgi:hypothetical protein